jgi:hypothetical protein
MTELLPDECRVLGTLIEKALTTPGQYPLSLNSLVTGVNQKNNRDPVVELDEDRALRAVDGLRAKGFARDVSFTGSRVEKYRHTAGEALEVRAPELALLAELLLRGPQTVGELRGRAGRMHPFDSLEVVESVLKVLSERTAPQFPLVRELPPAPGSRAPRWMQLLCEDLHPVSMVASPLAAPVRVEAGPSAMDRVTALEARMASLEEKLEAQSAVVAELKALLA